MDSEPVDPALAALSRWIVSRDEQAFALIVSSYERLVRHACRQVLGPGDDCEDAAQETFIRLARDAHQVHSSLSAWLYTCARSTAINLLSSQTARRRRERAVAAEAELEHQDRPEGADAESVALVERHLADLIPAEREVLLSYYCLGQTQEQIGRRLGISQVAAKKRIDKATEHLRRRLGARAAAAAAILFFLGGSIQACDGPALWPALAQRGLPYPRSTWARPAAVVVAALLLLGFGLAGWRHLRPAGVLPPTVAAPPSAPLVPVPVTPISQAPSPRPTPPPMPQIIAAPDGTVVVSNTPLAVVEAVPQDLWGKAWLPHDVRLDAVHGLDAVFVSPGVAQMGWAHRARPLAAGNVAIEARLRLAKGFCPFAFAWMGLCDASGGKGGFLKKDTVIGDPQRTCLADVGRWHAIRLEIGTPAAAGVPVAWIVDGDRCFEATMPAESTRHVAVMATSGWAEIAELRQEPLIPPASTF